jgi:hypothetical protein
MPEHLPEGADKLGASVEPLLSSGRQQGVVVKDGEAVVVVTSPPLQPDAEVDLLRNVIIEAEAADLKKGIGSAKDK